MASERYSFSLTTFRYVSLTTTEFNVVISAFSPSGKLVQIEYALAAVAAGAPSVGIKGLFLLLFIRLFLTFSLKQFQTALC